MKYLLPLFLASSAFAGPSIKQNSPPLATSTVQTSNIASDAIINAKIINASVDTLKIATDAIVAAKIANNVIGTSKLNWISLSNVGSGKIVCVSGTGTLGTCINVTLPNCDCQ